VPPADVILAGLTNLANDWRGLATVWHVLLAALLAALVSGWRPSVRSAGYLLSSAVLSVGVLAWLSGNPFNGLMFVVLTATLAAAAGRFEATPARLSSPGWLASAAAIIVFGWTYPHFLDTDSWTAYLYASPLGLVPCPTLSVVIGATLLFRDLRSRVWTGALIAAGLLYGLIGVFKLGVVLDWGLILASAVLATAARGTAERRTQAPQQLHRPTV
jgi:hypothetical protein